MGDRKKLDGFEPTLTEQHHKEACDIGNIWRRYEKTGVIEHARVYGAHYGEYPNAMDFKAAQDAIARTRSMFEAIPAKVRARFDNSPEKFLKWIQDERNRNEMVELGFGDAHLPKEDPTPASVATDAGVGSSGDAGGNPP